MRVFFIDDPRVTDSKDSRHQINLTFYPNVRLCLIDKRETNPQLLFRPLKIGSMSNTHPVALEAA
ncbi:MAG: hypothetical protein BECKG1743D_GA0114223_1000215 [Candidatus Kentron sp. G]|nr:MAG: hypothetical protein BECKG1743F_GA0114225_1000115 [Candidatus Kentron sp. G]VFM95448.1 MAG: hypothetical protein BECKG1743E_GA0114224_100043 [Candidatus Kentron sp. G]VFM97075.1 MAG: hypothetical protein BECKG1743D_GA0114223_1000215 [Candidatus Kentron sp. G]